MESIVPYHRPACGRGAGALWYASHEIQQIAPIIVADRVIEHRTGRFGRQHLPAPGYRADGVAGRPRFRGARGHIGPAPAARPECLQHRRSAGTGRRAHAGIAAQPSGRSLRARHFRRSRRGGPRRHAIGLRRLDHRLGGREPAPWAQPSWCSPSPMPAAAGRRKDCCSTGSSLPRAAPPSSV